MYKYMLLFLGGLALVGSGIWLDGNVGTAPMPVRIGLAVVGWGLGIATLILIWRAIRRIWARPTGTLAEAPREAAAVPQADRDSVQRLDPDLMETLPEDANARIAYCMAHRIFWTLETVALPDEITAYLDAHPEVATWVAAAQGANWDMPIWWDILRHMLAHPACPAVVAVQCLETFRAAEVFGPAAPDAPADDAGRVLVEMICRRDASDGFVETPHSDPDRVNRAALWAAIEARLAEAGPGWAPPFPPPSRLLTHEAQGPVLILPYVADETGLHWVVTHT